MRNEHDDDEIRESIPCDVILYWDGLYCLPTGYALREHSLMQVYFRGRKLHGVRGEAGAWGHAIAREKARRAREGQPLPPPRKAVPIPPGEDTDQYLIRERDKAAAMLADVIRERDDARNELHRIREMFHWEGFDSPHHALRLLSDAVRERDELRAKLERVRGVTKYSMPPHYTRYDCLREEADDIDHVAWEDIAAIIGKDGEA